jgi:calcineurin-like phosphoesterase family protein
MNTWFISDTHFGHANIIKYTGRPFKSVEEMDRVLIRNWNARVKLRDTVIFLGDFCFRNTAGGKAGEGTSNKAEFYRRQLNGDIVFIRGNHDDNNSLNTKIDSLVMTIGGKKIFCVHNPGDAIGGYDLDVVGHIHELWKIKRVSGMILVNVGVDVWNFHPVNIHEILREVGKHEVES